MPAAVLSYSAGVGNGRGEVITRGGDAGEANVSPAAVFTASVRPTAVFGLQLGAAYYLDRIAANAQPDAPYTNEQAFSAHAVWERNGSELIAEYVNVRHDPEGIVVSGAEPAATTSDGWYVHGAVKLGAFKPYGRLERLGIDEDDRIFLATVPDYEAQVVGVRWDFSALAALKAEARREKVGSAAAANSLYVQAALVVPSFVGM
jgi:hypothetical protein